jgi:lipid A 4'-phosphatase
MSVAIGAVDEGYWHQILWRCCVAGCLAAGALFLTFPEIDLAISRAVYSAADGFVGHRLAWVQWLRGAFIVFYFACLFGSCIGWARALGAGGEVLGANPQRWLFLVLCLGIGPGLIANLVFKDQWGRARPKHVAEFGGTKRFTPAPMPSDECHRGCSFISGEAATTFVAFYAAAAIVPQWAAALIVAGTLSGLAAGAMRIAQGAHFASDVVFAGLFMAMMVLALHRIMRAQPSGRSGRWMSPDPVTPRS